MRIKFKYLSACSLLVAASATAGVLSIPVSHDGWLEAAGAGATTVQDGGIGTQLNVATPNPSGAAQYTRKAWFGFDTSTLAALGAVNICSATITFNTGTNINSSFNGVSSVRFYGVVNENPGSVDTLTTEDKFDETLLTWDNAPGNLAGNVLAGDKVNGAILGDIPMPSPASSNVMTLTGLVGSPLVNFLQQANTNDFLSVAATYLGQNNTGYGDFTGLSFRAKEDTGFGAVLTINYNAGPCPVVITSQPQLTPIGTIFTGQPFSLTVAAVGSGTLYYQWRTNGIGIPGATSPTYNKASATVADSGNYDVVITNAANSVTSSPVVAVTISSISTPVVLTQPVSLNLYKGYTASFTVVATGGSLSYQWYRGATPVGSGTTSGNGQTNTLTLLNIQPADGVGAYTCTVTNPAGSTASAGRTLTVQVPVAGSFEEATVTNLPLAYYRLNETGNVQNLATNIGFSGSVDNGVYLGAAVSGAAGAFGTDPAVSGNVGKVAVPYSANLNSAGAFSAEAWLKPAATGANLCALSDAHVATPRSGWLIFQQTTGWNLRGYIEVGNDASVNVTAGGAPVIGNWYHVVVVNDGTTFKLYVNGVLGASIVTNIVTNPDGAFTIGQRSDGNFPWNGTADEVAYYNTALTASDVAAHYAAATTNAAGYAAQVALLSPVAYYRLNESFGPVIAVNNGTRGSSANGTYTPNSSVIGSPGLTLGVAGPQPAAFDGFEAANKALQIDNGWVAVAAPGLNMNTNRATITAWVKRNGDNASFDGLVMTTRAGSEPVCGIHFGNAGENELRYSWNDAGNTYNFASGLIIPDATWTFVALVVEPTQSTLYMGPGGGCLQSAVNTVSAANAAFAQGLFIGRDQTSRIYSGDIDDVAVYNRSLSPNDISALYSAGVPPIPPTITAQPQDQTVTESDSAVFTVAACGDGVFTYQWYSNNVAIAGANAASYTLSDLCATNSGNFTVVVCGASCVTSTVPAVLTVAALTNGIPISQDLVLHLKFNGNYADSSGWTNDASAPSGAPAFVAGRAGQGVQIATTPGTGYLQVANNAANLAFDAVTDLSLSFWVKYTGAFYDAPIFGNANNSTWNPGLVITEDAGQVAWTAVDGDTIVVDPVAGSPLINNGTWHQVVLVLDRAGVIGTTYVDGAQVGVDSLGALGTLDSGLLWTIGADPDGTYGSSTFALDDVGLWRRALSRFDVRSIYASGLEGSDLSNASVMPKVSISVGGGNATLSWLASPAGQCFVLKSAGTVTGPWSTVGTTPILASGRYSSTVPLTSTNQFFRLLK